MSCIVDSSATASFFLPDESSTRSAALAAKIGRDGATAPGLWQIEILNLLLMAVRRKRITQADQRQVLDAIDALPIALESALSEKQRSEVLSLASKHSLTAWDAVYLELAMRKGLPLATLDDSLAKAARAEGLQNWPESLR